MSLWPEKAPPGGASSRRAWLRSSCRACLGLAALAGGAAGHAQAPAAVPASVPAAASARFSRPGNDTDEGGLWAMMDREETRLRRSQFVIRDPAMLKYVQDIACTLVGDHCPDIRIYLVRTPIFNANMAPNGMMQVWSGLLLRLENEAQLAAVVGHEIGHYLERHTVERLRDMKSRAAFAQFMGMFGLVGAIGQIGVLASAFGFSREQEVRADRLGMDMMRKAGYDGREAARVWDNLTGELQVTGGEEAGRRSPMMASHPPTLSRRDDLLALAGTAGGRTGEAELRAVVAPHRLNWLHDEIRRGQFEESLVLFERMLRRDAQDAQVLYAKGEVMRQRAGKEDAENARAALEAASRSPQAPAETFRALGLVHRQRADAGAAATAFEQYLAAAPEAADAGLIKHYLSELKP